MTLPTLTELGATHGFTAGDLDTNGYVAIIPAYQKVYFADGRSQADGGYHKLDCINTRCVGTVTGTFTKGEIVTQANSGAAGNFDENYGSGASAWSLIYRTTTVEFDTTNVITGADSGATLTPSSVVAPPHWLPWVETSGKEGLPAGGANSGCLCFGRIVLNSIDNPNHWYMCRTGDTLDWLVSQDDIGTPVSSQTSKAGLVADALVVPIPFRDHYLVFGCENEVWVLRSDPAAGGIMTNITYSTGIFSPTSYCYDNNGNLFFVGMDGIYILSPDAIINALPPINLTERRLPNLFKVLGLNRLTDRVVLEYDKKRYGICVSITQMDGVWGTHFWLDLKENEEGQIQAAVFPESYADDKYRPTAMHYFDSRRGDYRDLLLGCNDGYIRKYDETIKSDDGPSGDAIESSVTFGPLVSDGKIRQRIEANEISLKLGTNTDGLTLNVFKADSAEKVIEKIANGDTPDATKTFSDDGLKSSFRQKVTAVALAVVLKNNTVDETWVFESMLINLQDGGRR